MVAIDRTWRASGVSPVVGSVQMEDLRRSIEAAGGLYTRAGLAGRWGVSRTIVGEYVLRPGFPPPVLIDGKREAWLAVEADAWRQHRP